MPFSDYKTALVTGASSGIGAAIVERFCKEGLEVHALARSADLLQEMSRRTGCIAHAVDVRDLNAVTQLTSEVKFDVLVNCAGINFPGSITTATAEQVDAEIGVNLQSALHLVRLIMPGMLERDRGHIINISSVAAVAHIPFQAFYSASKAAISSYSCALDNEVKPYGIQVTVVELGDIHTGFTQARQKVIVGDKEYGGRISRSVSQMEKDEQNGANPEVIGAYIAKIAEKKCKPICVAGAQYKFLSLLCKLLPCGIRGKIVGAIYAK